MEASTALPEFCLYLIFPEPMPLFGFPSQGCFVHLEYDVGSKKTELRLLLDTDQGLMPIILHLDSDSIQDNIGATDEYVSAQMAKLGGARHVPPPPLADMRENWERIISLILYLCSMSMEIRDESGSGRVPRRPGPVKTQKGWRIFPAEKTTAWAVGYETGELLQRAETKERGPMGERWSPSPHIRRAHWHSFWTGPRDGDRKLSVRWLHPILVGT